MVDHKPIYREICAKISKTFQKLPTLKEIKYFSDSTPLAGLMDINIQNTSGLHFFNIANLL